MMDAISESNGTFTEIAIILHIFFSNASMFQAHLLKKIICFIFMANI